jgi:hypothetical protein
MTNSFCISPFDNFLPDFIIHWHIKSKHTRSDKPSNDEFKNSWHWMKFSFKYDFIIFSFFQKCLRKPSCFSITFRGDISFTRSSVIRRRPTFIPSMMLVITISSICFFSKSWRCPTVVDFNFFFLISNTHGRTSDIWSISIT